MRMHYVLIATLLSGCVSLVRYDDNTYKTMTALKGEVKVFMDDCAINGASGEKAAVDLQGFRVKIAQAYEYEVGKSANMATVEQMKSLSIIFNQAYDRYSKNTLVGVVCDKANTGDISKGCLSRGYCAGKSKAVGSAFEIIISTESLKNK
jgi:hypothetical protein